MITKICNERLELMISSSENWMTIIDLKNQKKVFDDVNSEGITVLLNGIKQIKEDKEYTHIKDVGQISKKFEVYTNLLFSLEEDENKEFSYVGEECMIWSDIQSNSWIYQYNGLYYIEIGYYTKNKDDLLILEDTTCVKLDSTSLDILEKEFLKLKESYIN